VHDLSDGGLAVAATEMAMSSNIGVELKASFDMPAHAWYFGEDQARYLLSVGENSVNPVISTADNLGISAKIVGKVGGEMIKAEKAFNVSLSETRRINGEWLPNLMNS